MTKAATVRMGAVVVALSAFVMVGANASAEPAYTGFSAAAALSNRALDASEEDRNVVPQATVQWRDGAGFYAETAIAKTSWSSQTLALDTRLTAGRHLAFDGTSIDFSASYQTMGAALKATSAVDAAVRLTQTIGPVTVSARGAGTSQPGMLGQAWIGAGAVRVALADWLSLSTGYDCRWSETSALARTRWDMGASAEWHNVSFDVRYVSNGVIGTEPSVMPVGHAGVTALVTYNIRKWF